MKTIEPLPAGVEDREWSLKLELGPSPASNNSLTRLVRKRRSIDRGHRASRRTPHRLETELDRPRILRLEDPFGFPIAFYYESVKHPWLLQQFHLHRGPGIQRIDHINVLSPHVKQLSEWYQKHLDFRLTESTEDDEGRIWATWMHRKGHAHDLATTNGAGPRLHHFAYWLPDGARISQLCDILAGAFETDRIERGPGRHGITNAYFLYLRDPDGHRIELYTSDYLSVDPDFEPIRWQLHDPRRQALWGGMRRKAGSSKAAWCMPSIAAGRKWRVRIAGLPAYVR